ncbi:ABC transporter substrate-binding protein, partial [Halomonas sp. 707D7]|uniref:ABC transporter substrate-binding protein n=1 Tax=Halomonas sp. 707D7 TaxID=1681044 RepID=UPI0020A17D99
MTMPRKALVASIAFAAAAVATSVQAEISDGEVRIGYLADMSGTYRDLAGPGGLAALEMAVADFGGSVDGAPIVLFSADDRNSADVGANT